MGTARFGPRSRRVSGVPAAPLLDGQRQLDTECPPGLEVGWWSEDPEVLAESTAFLCDVLAISEPLGSNAPMPEPELLPVEFDDDAMVEAIGGKLQDGLDDR